MRKLHARRDAGMQNCRGARCPRTRRRCLRIQSSGPRERKSARHRGVRITEYPGVIPTGSRDQLEKKVRDVVVSDLLQGFEAPIDATTETAVEPAPREIVFTGSLDQVQQDFHDELWSDGPPVLPW